MFRIIRDALREFERNMKMSYIGCAIHLPDDKHRMLQELLEIIIQKEKSKLTPLLFESFFNA